jgi:hypothetical protein
LVVSAHAKASAVGCVCLVVTGEQRIRELEDALYAKHAAVLELPNINREIAAPAEEPLPTVVQRFIDGFEDPESREEYEAEARRLLRTRSPDATVAALMARVS